MPPFPSPWWCLGDGLRGRDPLTGKHFLWGAGQSPQGTAYSLANDIVYHGGNAGPGAIGIQKAPAVYLIYWGTEWATGFTTTDVDGRAYSSRTLQTYLNTFMANLGGSPWAAVQTQYAGTSRSAQQAAPGSQGPTTSATRSTSWKGA